MTQSVLFLTTILVFAILVMAALLDIKRCNFTRKVLLQLAILTVGTVFVNLLVLSLFGLKLYRSLYFILIQLPVFIAFWFLSDYRGIKLLFTLLTTIVLSSIPVNFRLQPVF